MKKILITSLCLLLGISAFAQIASINSFKVPLHKVMVVAHRGVWTYAPENSLKAIQRCIDIGVDVVEIDVQKTKDGHLVLLHDRTLDRTTNGVGRVSNYTLAEIKKLRLKSNCGIEWQHQQIPTLEEAMLLAKNKIKVNLDKTVDTLFAEAFEVIKNTGTLEQTIFKGKKSRTEMVEKFGAKMDSVRYMPIFNEKTPEPETYLSGYLNSKHTVGVELGFNNENAFSFTAIPKIINSGKFALAISLWADLVAGHDDEMALLEGPEKSWGWLIDHGANGIMTDRPEELIAFLKSKGMR
jgi:glycerophosphoryl diester phosphodiesterase